MPRWHPGPGKSEALGWDLASVPFMLPGDSHVQARSRPRWPTVLVCSGLRGFPGLGTFSAGIGTVQANRDETRCFAGRQPWIWHGEHPGDPPFLTEASFHVSRPVVEGSPQPEVHPHIWLWQLCALMACPTGVQGTVLIPACGCLQEGKPHPGHSSFCF